MRICGEAEGRELLEEEMQQSLWGKVYRTESFDIRGGDKV